MTAAASAADTSPAAAGTCRVATAPRPHRLRSSAARGQQHAGRDIAEDYQQTVGAINRRIRQNHDGPPGDPGPGKAG